MMQVFAETTGQTISEEDIQDILVLGHSAGHQVTAHHCHHRRLPNLHLHLVVLLLGHVPASFSTAPSPLTSHHSAGHQGLSAKAVADAIMLDTQTRHEQARAERETFSGGEAPFASLGGVKPASIELELPPKQPRAQMSQDV